MLSSHRFRISLADPHPITLDGLAQAFAHSRRFEIVSASTSSAEAFDEVARTRPDLFVTDLRLPCEGGIALLTKMKRASLQPRVLVFADALCPDALENATALGIQAFVSKRLGSSVIVEEAFRLIAFRTGDTPLVLGFEDPCGSERLAILSAREHAVLNLAARGLANKEIAAHLGIMPGTVKVHLHAIYRKLGVSRRAELTRFGEGRASGVASVAS